MLRLGSTFQFGLGLRFSVQLCLFRAFRCLGWRVSRWGFRSWPYNPEVPCGSFRKLGVPCCGVLIIRILLLGYYTRVPYFRKLPCKPLAFQSLPRVLQSRGLGFRVQGLGFRVLWPSDLRFQFCWVSILARVEDLEFMASCLLFDGWGGHPTESRKSKATSTKAPTTLIATQRQSLP